MWNKRFDEAPTPRLQPEPSRSPMTPAVPRPQTPATPPAQATAVIGASMTIKGDIRTQEELFVDGDVEGSVESQSLLTVGPNGKVRANIKAREVVVYGSVRGDVDATGKISIHDNGSVIGDIKTSGISIDDGAYFKGSIDIIRPEPKVTTKPVKTEPTMAAAGGQS